MNSRNKAVTGCAGLGPFSVSSLLGAALLSLSLTAVGARLANEHILGSGVQLQCASLRPTEIECDYRLVKPSVVEHASASIGDLALPAPVVEPYIEPPSASAILILVDTSDPARQPVVEKKIRHIEALLDGSEPHHRFGLASFDSDLRLLAEIGTPRETLRALASEMRAVGKTTELYRNTLEAVRVLAKAQAERRGLLIMSDGLAEDRAYFHGDVVDAARSSGVVIYGVGYPRSVSLSVALQSLRRLAEETGGRFIATDAAFELPPGSLENAFAVLDNGGRITVDLEPASRAGLGGAQELSLALSSAAGRATATVPLTLPGPAPGEPVVKVVEVEVPKLVEVPKVIEVPAPATQADSPPEAAAPILGPTAADAVQQGGFTVWLWYVLLPGALLVALLLILLLTLRARRTGEAERPGSAQRPPMRTLAYLECQDGSEERHAVTSAAFRIGRHSDNDLSIRDSSVSRQHAEIHRRRDGSFTITDLDSMNGVFVNQEKIDSVTLSDGDIIEIGDKAFCFQVEEEEALAGEETVVLKTVNPVSPLPEVAGQR